MKILVQNKRFEGIRPTPNPKPNPDGSYTVKLTTTQFKVFEENQKKPAIPVPAEPAKPASGKEPEPEKPSLGKEPEKSAPGQEPKKPEEKPEEKPVDQITVTKEPSTSLQ